MDSQIALVTGANSGVGFEVARQLAQAGYSVWLGARSVRLGKRAVRKLVEEGLDVRLLHVDVTDVDQIRQAVGAVARETTRLDVLVNNASIFLKYDGPPSTVDVKCIQDTLDVNVFGAIRVTQAFLPLLRSSEAGRVVMMSSGLGRLAGPSDSSPDSRCFHATAYNTSISALAAVALAFANEVRESGIKVNVANPGFMERKPNCLNGATTIGNAARVAVMLSTLPEDGPTGRSFSEHPDPAW